MATCLADCVAPGSFEAAAHYYPRVLNAQIHPTVAHFLTLSRARLVNRYCHMNPRVDANALSGWLAYMPRNFKWAGADLFHVANASGRRMMVVIETNSCPSGQKSMPLRHDTQEEGGYRLLVEQCFLPTLQGRRLPEGGLAVIYDKNRMESSGYAATIADCTGEPVWLAPLFDNPERTAVRFDDGIMYVRATNATWEPVRAAFRYVTQRPWNRIPLHTKTLIFNPVLGCLAGGRNKMVAAKAYDLFNAELEPAGLKIHSPDTILDVSHTEIPLWVKRLGGFAAIKIPYLNAGQGVFTITSDAELDAFMAQQQHYDQFIVQSLIGNVHWSSQGVAGRFYHVATVPNRRDNSYVADLRVMVCATDNGFIPLAIYARRARRPLVDTIDAGTCSWDMLGTNLSVRDHSGEWNADTNRLLLMDRKDFDVLGLGIDDLIEAYVQTVLATIAIDKLATTLMTKKGRFKSKLFASLDNDPMLIREIRL